MKIIEAARPRAVFFADTAQTKAIDAHGPKRASGRIQVSAGGRPDRG
ncbi:hypothetical protein PSP20601_05473 [Pandoraea sputorum]|nr:hypothetical protein PSP20601_05473 [Pandoraea sputorum]